jgi:hypothetical protein
MAWRIWVGAVGWYCGNVLLIEMMVLRSMSDVPMMMMVLWAVW